MGKNYKLFNVGDKVKITFSHSDDLNMVGTLVEVRPSFCKIDLGLYKPNGVKPDIKNHTYGQFEKIEDFPPLVAFLTSDLQIKIHKEHPNEGGFGNGYVAIPKSHPLYAKFINYSSIDTFPLNVHGDVTYCSINIPKSEHIIFARKGESIPEEALFIGFDTFHFGDNPRNWDFARCMNEVIRLRTQLENL